MDQNAAEYLLSMASSYATGGFGLLRQIHETVHSGSICTTLRHLRRSDYFEISPTGEFIGLTPQGFELLRTLKAKRRATRRARPLNRQTSVSVTVEPRQSAA